MTKKTFFGAMAVVTAVALTGSALVASNMGFKLNYTLVAQSNLVSGPGESGTSLDGTSLVALPFNRQGGLSGAGGLRADVGASAASVSRYLRRNNGLQTYSGGRTVDFPLADQYDCYQVRVTGTANVPYIIVGSDKPGTPLTFYAQGNSIPANLTDVAGTSLDGTNCYPFAYHSTAATAGQLRADIGAAAVSVSRLTRHNNGLMTYSGGRTTDFALTPGEGYLVRVTGTTNVPYTPSHY